MRRRLTRLALVVSAAAALCCGLVASGAPAATNPDTTLPASSVTSSSAVLNATIFTGGYQVSWQFQYGTSTAYGLTTQSQTISAGHGTVKVSFLLKGLKARTTFHFRIITTLVLPSHGHYYFFAGKGIDLSFKTKSGHGTLSLLNSKLTERKGFTYIPIQCSGTRADLPCAGRLYVNTKFKGKTVACATHVFALRTRHKTNVKALTSKKCLALLLLASKHTIKGTVTFHLIGGQKAFTKSVTITRKG
jgi:hypothetical protein